MKLYYSPASRAVRVAWLLEELGLEYEVQKFALGDRAMREPDYLSVHPMGRVPALEDRGVTLFESGAIIQYILANYANGQLRQWTIYTRGRNTRICSISSMVSLCRRHDHATDEHTCCGNNPLTR